MGLEPTIRSSLPAGCSTRCAGRESKAAEEPEKNPAAVALGRLGGLKGGKARAAKLTPAKRKAIAKKAAAKRWGKTSVAACRRALSAGLFHPLAYQPRTAQSHSRR